MPMIRSARAKSSFGWTKISFLNMLVSYISLERLRESLLAAERSKLSLYRYGVKGFVLSMMETAVNVSQTQVPVHVVHDILNIWGNIC